MSRRIILILGVLVLLGLVAGLFTGPIEKALGIAQGTQATTNIQKMLQAQGKPNTPAPGTPPGNNNQPTQTNVLATDTFQRPNQASWGTASDGRQWGGDANAKPAFSITNLKGQIAGGQGALDAVIGIPTDNVDVTISGSINQFGNGVNFGAVLRWTSPNNWYKAFIDGNKLGILKNVNGQSTMIKQVDVKTTAGVAQTLRFRSLGTMLFAKVWPSATTEPQNWMLVVDDHAIPTGQVGIRVFAQPATVITITSFNAITASTGDKI